MENQAQRIESTKKLLPFTGVVSAKVDRFDNDYPTSWNSCVSWSRAGSGVSPH